MHSSREPNKVIYSQNHVLRSKVGGGGERLGGCNDHSAAYPSRTWSQMPMQSHPALELTRL